MNTLRTDFAGMVLVALGVAAIVALTLAGQPVPELLNTVTLGAATFAFGAALPTRVSSSTPATMSTPATPSTPAPPTALAAVDQPVVPDVVPDVVPAPRPAGRDWTETIPKITPEMIAADKAARS